MYHKDKDLEEEEDNVQLIEKEDNVQLMEEEEEDNVQNTGDDRNKVVDSDGAGQNRDPEQLHEHRQVYPL